MRSLNIHKLGLIAIGLFIVLVTATGSISVIWLRQQISHKANKTAELERALIATERENNQVLSRIAQLHNPEHLKMLAQGKLRMPSKNQVVWVNAFEKTQKQQIARTQYQDTKQGQT